MRPPEWKLEQLFRGCALVVVLDGVQDPGNAGAIVRAAEAFGATGAMFLKGTVSPYNPKTLRASAGRCFAFRLCTAWKRRWRARRCSRTGWSCTRACPPVPARRRGALADVDFTRPCAPDHRQRSARRGRASCGRRRSMSRFRRWAWSRSTRPWRPAFCSTKRGGRGPYAHEPVRHHSARARLPARARDAKRPLAERMRPERLEDFIGQEHILGPGKPLRAQIERDELSSMILWGPPGVGKTTLAQADRARHAAASSSPSARC